VIQYALVMRNVLVINGPNLNLLGTREPDIYGSTTLSELESLVKQWGADRDLEISCYQSNHEGEIIDRLHAASHTADGLVINAGAFTHYSYAIHDAIVATELPAVEVHISNVKAREPWRHHSVLAPACVYTIYGRGIEGYRSALDHLVNRTLTEVHAHSYGPAEDQVGDLRLPEGPGPHPVVVLIHGGFWRDHWTRDIMEGLAVNLLNHGWATWNLEYQRVGTGGGWPATLEDIAAGIDYLKTLATDLPLDLDRVMAVGHSAGGHLALWAAARPNPPGGIPNLDAQIPLRAAVALAPVSDLGAGQREGIGDGAVENFIGRTPEDAPERYAAASPAELLPLRVPQIIIHGTADEAVPVAMSRSYVEAATAAGDRVKYHELAGADHMNLIDPSHEAWALAVSELEQLRQH
jgi:3-dehydroquinate dehydratase type II